MRRRRKGDPMKISLEVLAVALLEANVKDTISFITSNTFCMKHCTILESQLATRRPVE